MSRLNLRLIPLGYPVGWCPALPVDLEYFNRCDVKWCRRKPKYEIYLGTWVADVAEIPGVTDYWWVCCTHHKNWLARNRKAGSVPKVPQEHYTASSLSELVRQLEDSSCK